MKMQCKSCGVKYSEPGALLFGPPWGSKPNIVEKYHICKKCFNDLLEEYND